MFFIYFKVYQLKYHFFVFKNSHLLGVPLWELGAYISSLGSVNLPVTAAAAAIIGLAKSVLEPGP
jgi:hypothetical protein